MQLKALLLKKVIILHHRSLSLPIVRVSQVVRCCCLDIQLLSLNLIRRLNFAINKQRYKYIQIELNMLNYFIVCISQQYENKLCTDIALIRVFVKISAYTSNINSEIVELQNIDFEDSSTRKPGFSPTRIQCSDVYHLCTTLSVSHITFLLCLRTSSMPFEKRKFK